MISYFDTSFVLNILFGEKGSRKHLEIWKKSEYRFSSMLLAIESVVTLRKLKNQTAGGSDDIIKKEIILRKMLEEISLIHVDSGIFDLCASHENLDALRSLDAIHAATALHIRQHIGELVFHTLDTRMKAVAEKCRLKVS